MSSIWTSDTGTARGGFAKARRQRSAHTCGLPRRHGYRHDAVRQMGLVGTGETKLLTRRDLIKYFPFTCDSAHTTKVILDTFEPNSESASQERRRK